MTPDQVLGAVLTKIVDHERFRDNWLKHAKTDEDRQRTIKVCEDEIAKEWNYYSTVEVVKFGRGKYGLVYAGDTSNYTGSFGTAKKAEHWFLNGGR